MSSSGLPGTCDQEGETLDSFWNWTVPVESKTDLNAMAQVFAVCRHRASCPGELEERLVLKGFCACWGRVGTSPAVVIVNSGI